MAYSIKIDCVGRCGISQERIASYTTETEIEALTIAAYELDVQRADTQRTAAIFDEAGRLVLAYAGRARTNPLR